MAPTSVVARPLKVVLSPGPAPHRRLANVVRRRLQEPRRRSLTQEVLASIDAEGYRARFASTSDSGRWEESEKFRDLDAGLGLAASRYLIHRLDRLAPGRVLDLGCGSGYFLLVCRHEGHAVTGLDIPTDHGFNDMVRYFGIDRVDHWITPADPLPDVAEPFDLITAFLTTFNKAADGGPWRADDWRPFLSAARDRLVPGGRLVIQFNRNKVIDAPYPPDVARLLDEHPGFSTKRFADCASLVAR